MLISAWSWWAGCAASPPADAPPACAPGCVPTSDGVFPGWMQVAVDGRGAAWVSWVEVDGPAVTGTWLARSEAEGAPLSAAAAIPVAEPPVIGSTEKPSLAASGERLAFAYTGRGELRHGDAKVVWVHTAPLDGPFGEPTQVDDLSGVNRVTEQVRAAFGAGGELWVAWKRQVYGLEDHPHWAREGDGFVPVEVSPELSAGHDCSPPDFRFGPSDRPLYALRSNLDGWLQTMLVAGDAPPVQVSDDVWAYNADVCPVDGPRVAERPDGSLVVAWLAPAGDVWRVHTNESPDGGQTFALPAVEDGDVGLGERWVAMVADEERVWLAVESVFGVTRVSAADVPARELVSPEGQPLAEVELAANAGRVVAIGKDPDGGWWLVDLRP